MRKVILYVLTAVALGVGIMLFPLWTFFNRYHEDGPIVFTGSLPQIKPMTESPNWETYRAEQTSNLGNFGNAPTQSTDVSLQMLTIGAIAALVVYLIVRRRVPRPAPPFTFPRA